MIDQAKLLATIDVVLDHVAAKRFNDLERISENKRLSAIEMSDAVQEYGRTLKKPVRPQIDVIEVQGRTPQRWSIVLSLETVEEGNSDLSLELTLIETSEQLYQIEIDDLLVR